ncbi:MAG: HAMP domain-containing protein [Sulfurimonas sp.]|nr:HAMP domain-containing protein [Sulfurimonas sp.]
MINIKFKLSTKIAILTFVLSLFGIASLGVISFQQSNQLFKNNLIKNTQKEVEKSSFNISQKIKNAKKNLQFIRASEPIEGILRTTKNEYHYDEEQNMHISSWVKRLENIFLVTMKQNSSFFQIRLIGVKDGGKEIIKVSRIKENITIMPPGKLAKKGNRNYFNESIKLNDMEIYLSKVNLNKENNVISLPLLPTIRVATPIYNGDKVYAIIVINIDISKFLNFDALDKNSNLKTYISNSKGEYIYNLDKEKSFAFEFGRECLIQDDFPVKDFIKNKNDSMSIYIEETSSAFSIEKINLLEDIYIYLSHTASSEFFEKESQNYIDILVMYSMIIAIVIAILIAILLHYLTSPIAKLTKVAKDISAGKKVDFNALNIKSNDEVEELATSFKYMLNSLSRSKNDLQNQANQLEDDVEEKTKELRLLNEDLEKRIDKALLENTKQLQTLQEQSKMASMGEMIGAIAHQWRQPLNAVGLSIQNLKYDYMAGEINEKFINDYIKENKKTIKFMSTTIDDFRNFFRIDKEKVNFQIKKTISSVVSMQSAQLKSHQIRLNISGDEFEYFGLQSEFQQVVLNLINNAKDALVEKNIQIPQIDINIDKTKQQVSIQDNAGGIPDEIIHRIFEPYFTTKEQGKGTGMGLYMSKMIIEENMGAKLSVQSKENGTCFYIDFTQGKT